MRAKKALYEYTLSELDDLPVNKKMLYSVVVSSDIKENQVKSTVRKIISELTASNDNIDEIILDLYSDKDVTNNSPDIGTIIWAPFGKLGNISPEIAKNNDRNNYNISYEINDNMEEYLQQRKKAENKFGLTEKKRRQFFKDIVTAEDRANIEAERLYPTDILKSNYNRKNIAKKLDKEHELMNKYRAKVRRKYGISKKQKTEIIEEGFKENWPFD